VKNTLKKIYYTIPFKKEIFQILKPFNIPRSIYQHLYFHGIFKVNFQKCHFLIKHYGHQVENDIFWSSLTGGWEKVSLQLWIALCKESNTIIDIGANTGVYSLVAKAVNHNSKVYAFEPVKRVFQKLKTNCEINEFDVRCFEMALSNYDGEATIYDPPTEHVYSVTVNKNLFDNLDAIETKIQARKLATIIRETNIDNIDLMKIDVETHEPEVLEGMEYFLEKFQPTLLIEILNDTIGQRVQEILKKIDYLYFSIDEASKPEKVVEITKSYRNRNYLICKKQIAKKIGLIQ
jgi:FkbM family methyltransferase